MSHVHGAYRDFSNHNILTQLLLRYDSWNKNPTAGFYSCPHQQAVQEQCWHFHSSSQQTDSTSFKITFYQGLCNKTWLLPWDSPLLPSFTRKDTGPRGNTKTAGVTFPTGQVGAQLHFGPKSNLWCFTWNADPAVHWLGVFKSCAGHLSVWRSPVPDEEAASTAEGMRLLLSPEAAQWLPGNAAETAVVGIHRVRFSEEGEINPLRDTKAWAPTIKQHVCWCRGV